MSAARDMTLVLRFKTDGTAEVVGAAKAVSNAVSGTGSAAAEAGAQLSRASVTAAQAQRAAAAAASEAARANRDAASAAEAEASAIARFRQMIDPASAAIQAASAETERLASWTSQARIAETERTAGLALLAERMGLSDGAAARLAEATANLNNQVISGAVSTEARAAAVEGLWRAEVQAATAAEEAAIAAARGQAASEQAARAQIQAAQAAGQLSGAVERIRASYDPLYAAQAQIIAQMGMVDQAWAAGAISAQTAGTVSDQLTAELYKLSPAGKAAAAAAEQLAQAQAAESLAAESEAAALSALRERLDPVSAAQRALWAEAEQVEAWFRQGALSADEYGRYLDQLDERLQRLPDHLDETARSTGLASYQIQNLSYQIQDAFTQLAGGQNPFLILAQQGPQAAEAVGGFGEALALLTSPAALAVVAVAALAVPMALVIGRAAALQSQLRELTGTVQAYNSSLSGRELQAWANDMASVSKYSRAETTAALANLSQYRTLYKETLADIKSVAADFATATGQDLSQAVTALGDAFSHGYEGVKKLDEAYGFLTASQLKQIRTLMEQGKQTEAFRIALGALQGQMKSAADTITTDWDRAMRDLGNAWDTALDDMAKSPKVQALLAVGKMLAEGVSHIAKGPTDAEEINRLTLELEGLQRRKAETPRLVADVASFFNVKDFDSQIAEVQKKLDALRSKSAQAPANTPQEQYGPGKSEYDQNQRVLKSIQDMRAETEDYTAAMAGGRAERERALVQMDADTQAREKGWSAAEKQVFIEGELKKKLADRSAAAGDAAAASGVETRAAEKTAEAYAKSEAAGLAYSVIGQKLAEASQSQYGQAWALAQAQDQLAQKYAQASSGVSTYIASLGRQLIQEQALAAAAGQGEAAEARATNAITAQAQVREKLLALNAERVVLDERHAAGQVSDLAYQAQILVFEQQRQGVETERETILNRLNSITAVQALKSLNQQNGELEKAIQGLQTESSLLLSSQTTRERELALMALKSKYQQQIALATGDEKAKLQAAYDKAAELTGQYYAGKESLDEATKSAEALKTAGADISKAFSDFFSSLKKNGKDAFKNLASTIADTLDNLTGTLTYNAIINLITSSSSSGSSSGGTNTASGTASTTSNNGSSTTSSISGMTNTLSLASALSGGSSTLLSQTIPSLYTDAFGSSGILGVTGADLSVGLSNWGSLGGLAGGMIGSTAANLVFDWSSVEASTGASIGSTVGGLIGSLVLPEIPIVGPLIGSFLGDAIGGFIGDMFADVQYARMGFGVSSTASGQLQSSGTWALDGIDQSSADSAASQTITALNALLGAVGTTMQTPDMWALGYSSNGYNDTPDGYYYRQGYTGTDSGGYGSYDEAFIGMVKDMITSGAWGDVASEVMTVVQNSVTTSADDFGKQLELAANWDSIISTLSTGSINYADYVTTTAQDTIDGYKADLQTYQDLAVGGGLDVNLLNKSYVSAIERMIGLIDGSATAMSDAQLTYLENQALIADSFDLLTQAGMKAKGATNVVAQASANYQATAIADFTSGIQDTINNYQGKTYLADFQSALDNLSQYYAYADTIGAGTSAVDNLLSETLQYLVSNADNAAAAVNDLAAAYPDYVTQIWAAYDAVTASSYAIAQGSMGASINALDPGYKATLNDTLYGIGLLPSSLGGVLDTLQGAWDSLTGGAGDAAVLNGLVQELFATAVTSGTMTVDQVDSIIGQLSSMSQQYWQDQADLIKSNADLVARAYTAVGDTLSSTMASFDYNAVTERYSYVNAGGNGAFYDSVSTVERLQTELGVYNDLIGKQIDAAQQSIDASTTLADTLRSLADTASALRVDSTLSTGSTYTRFLEAQSQYQTALATTKDTSLSTDVRDQAAAKLDGLSRTYLDYGLALYGPTQAYAAIFNQVQSDLTSLSGNVAKGLQDQIDLQQKTIDRLTSLQEAINGTSADQVMSLDQLTSVVSTKLTDLASAQSSLSGVLSGFAAGVTSALQSVYSSGGGSGSSSSSSSGDGGSWTDGNGNNWTSQSNSNGTVTEYGADGAVWIHAAYAEGGRVTNGTYGRDSVLAMLSGGGAAALAGGEYVMPTAQTERYLPALEAMRAGVWSMPGYTGGGPILEAGPAPVAFTHHWGPAGMAPANDRAPSGVTDLRQELERQTAAVEEQNRLLRAMHQQGGALGDHAAQQRDETNQALDELKRRSAMAAAQPARNRGAA